MPPSLVTLWVFAGTEWKRSSAAVLLDQFVIDFCFQILRQSRPAVLPIAKCNFSISSKLMWIFIPCGRSICGGCQTPSTQERPFCLCHFNMQSCRELSAIRPTHRCRLGAIWSLPTPTLCQFGQGSRFFHARLHNLQRLIAARYFEVTPRLFAVRRPLAFQDGHCATRGPKTWIDRAVAHHEVTRTRARKKMNSAQRSLTSSIRRKRTCKSPGK